jgi:ribosomal protein L19
MAKVSTKFIKRYNMQLHLNPLFLNTDLMPGYVITLVYNMFDLKRDINQTFKGVIISNNNNTFILRQQVLNVGVEHTFSKFSPRIISLIINQKLKVSRSKLYFTRSLQLDKFLK